MHNPKLTLMLFSVLLFCLAQTSNATVDIYANTQADRLAPVTKNALYRVYVPNGKSGTVSVIDPTTYQVVDTFHTGSEPQHVVPAYDLQTLWVLNNKSNTLTPIDPTTAKPGKNIPVEDPYNLYFTPDGKFAIVVCERRKELQFRDPKTMQLISTIPTQCSGANHMEFTADNHYAIVTCEYAGKLAKIDLVKHVVDNYLLLSPNMTMTTHPISSSFIITADGKPELPAAHSMKMTSMPQDIRSSADGSIFFVADMMKGGLVVINPVTFKIIGFIPTGLGTHGIYPSRDGKLLYVSNRGCGQMSCRPHSPGNISVVDPVQRKVVATWPIPQGGSPDMGNVTANGRELWLSGRYDHEVYVFDTTTGQLTHRIPVGKGPHGLAVWPQPGRYSLGHTGNMR